MPYIHIRLTDEGVTKEQKQQLIAGATEVVVSILGKKPELTHVVIEEVPVDNWGVGARQYSETLQQKAVKP